MAYVVGTTTITPHMKGDDPVKGVLKDVTVKAVLCDNGEVLAEEVCQALKNSEITFKKLSVQ